jgi:uncharacterized membrane protein
MTFPVSRSGRRRIAWAAVAVSAIGTAVFSGANYLTGDASASRIPLNPDVAVHYLTIVVHALPASLLLLIGPFQFATRLLAGRPGLHRALGYVYMVSVVVAALAAIVAATFSVDGISVQVAFYLLSAAWLYTLFQGFRAIRQGQIQLHRIWLIRNYALSFAAVALRAFIGLGVGPIGPVPLADLRRHLHHERVGVDPRVRGRRRVRHHPQDTRAAGAQAVEQAAHTTGGASGVRYVRGKHD